MANVTQFYATGFFCTLEPLMPCVQDCELILMRSGSEHSRWKKWHPHSAVSAHGWSTVCFIFRNFKSISSTVIRFTLLKIRWMKVWTSTRQHSAYSHTMHAHHISFALSELQPAMSSYLSIFPTKSLPLNGWGSQDASWLMIGNKPYLHIYRLCMQTPAEVLATDRCRVADSGGRWRTLATISVGLSNKEALLGTTAFGRIPVGIAITRPEFVSSFTCEIW